LSSFTVTVGMVIPTYYHQRETAAANGAAMGIDVVPLNAPQDGARRQGAESNEAAMLR
jgi:hypothetical protein